MNLFQLIITVSVVVYVLSSLYFAITGRILTKKKEQKEDERYEQQHTVEEQIGVLTQRIGAITAENDRVNAVARSYMEAANKYRVLYENALKEKEEWQKEANDLQEQLKKKKKNSKKGDE